MSTNNNTSSNALVVRSLLNKTQAQANEEQLLFKLQQDDFAACQAIRNILAEAKILGIDMSDITSKLDLSFLNDEKLQQKTDQD